MIEVITLGNVPLRFVEHPLYADAHPGEPCEPHERCLRCARAQRLDTGDLVLLWQAEGKNWTVSRHDPEWQRHRDELFPQGAFR